MSKARDGSDFQCQCGGFDGSIPRSKGFNPHWFTDGPILTIRFTNGNNAAVCSYSQLLPARAITN